MTALYIILGIIAFFFVLFSIPLHVSFDYTDYMYLKIRWLFLKLKILPLEDKEKKEKKEKKPKKEKPKEEKPKEEKPKEEKSGENPIIAMVKAKGYDGMMEIISNLGKALGGMFARIFKSFRVEHFAVNITVGKGDAAETAIEYGKTCNKVFPVCGLICSTTRVKTYDVEVTPDFLANHNSGEFSAEFYLVPRKLINAILIVAVELVFKVALKLLLGNKKTDKTETKQQGGQNAEAVH